MLRDETNLADGEIMKTSQKQNQHTNNAARNIKKLRYFLRLLNWQKHS